MIFFKMLRDAIRYSAVFMFGSTGETITEKAGHLNLGTPGIMCVGALGGCLGEIWYVQSLNGAQPNAFWAIVIGILSAMFFAGLMGLLYCFLTVTLRCNQNVTGLAITTLGAGIFKYWGTATPFETKNLLYTAAKCFLKTFPNADTIGDFWRVFFSYGALVYVAIVVAIVVTIIFKKTRIGLQLRAIGENPAAADAAGINVIRYKYISIILGSAISGVGGLFYVLDYSAGSLEYVIDAMGWIAVAIVIFSLWRPTLGIAGSILFGFLLVLPSYVTKGGFAVKYVIQMIPYLVTVVVLIITSIRNKRENQPPAALGMSYFREDR